MSSVCEECRSMMSGSVTERQKERTTGRLTRSDIHLKRCIALFPCYSQSMCCRAANGDALASTDSLCVAPQKLSAPATLSYQVLLPPLHGGREASSGGGSGRPPSPRHGPALCQLTRVIGEGVTSAVILATEIDSSEQRPTRGGVKTEGTSNKSSLKMVVLSDSFRCRPRWFVVKFIDLEGDNDTRRNRAMREIQCYLSCDFCFILRCYRNLVRRRDPCGPSDNATNPVIAVALELEFANNGDLKDEIRARGKQNKTFSEYEALLIFLQILLAVYYLHKRNIIHRDIKAANVMLFSSGIVKLGDFGLSKFVECGAKKETRGSLVGTPYYLAPEIWQRKPYSMKADMFSLGVLLYELLTLKQPFCGSNIDEVIQSTIHSEVDLDSVQSSDVADIIRSLLSKDPLLRPSTLDILSHPLLRTIFAAFVQRVHKEEGRDAHSCLKSPKNDDLQDSDCTRLGCRANANGFLGRDEVQRILGDLTEVQKDVFYALTKARVRSDSIFSLDDKTFKSSRVLLDGPIKKTNNQGIWKSRYLCLNWVRASHDAMNDMPMKGEVEIVFALNKFSSQRVCKSAKLFLDCFPVPERFAPEGSPFVFSLFSKLGNSIAFQADSKEEQEKWISAFLDCIEYVRHEEVCGREREDSMTSTSLKGQSESTFGMTDCS